MDASGTPPCVLKRPNQVVLWARTVHGDNGHAPTKVKHHSEQLEKILALLRTGANESTTVNSDSGGRYEAVLKHCSDGLLDRDFF
jgi:hypothetical protein